MERIIHYCWFGEKKLPKLAKKCIKSWKKHLPDYKIMFWNEKNFDINMTDFSKKAYEAKKYAFVADVARVYALKEYGGIYLDTDMKILKSIDKITKNDAFIGVEFGDTIAAGVIGTKTPHHPFIEDLWKFYNESKFDANNLSMLAIPNIFTKILKNKYGLKNDFKHNQIIKNGICIYTRDYFYPIDYNHDKENEFFSDNTHMIHYYDGSWAEDHKSMVIYRIFGKNITTIIWKLMRITKKTITFPYKVIKRKKIEKMKRENFRKNVTNAFENIDSSKPLIVCNSAWLGTSIATHELFENVVSIKELESGEEIDIVKEKILETNPKLLVFSAFALGWDKLIREIKQVNNKIEVKIIYHGGNGLLSDEYDYDRFSEILILSKENIISSIGFIKKSMYELYSKKGYNAEFVMNTVRLTPPDTKDEQSDVIKIGLYASGNRWVKNFYNQLAATSLVENAVVDCIPINKKVKEFSNKLNINITGTPNVVPREELLIRMSQNDINVYVTYTECAPLLPLESLELGVPCITGNNHHYFVGSKLYDYLVVEEVDNPVKIYEKILLCFENKDEIIELYKKWKKEYDKEVEKNNEKFLSN